MEFWSKGLGKKTIAMAFSKGEAIVAEDGLCVRGIMDAPVSWEYVMLLEETDLRDFFALLQEPSFARYVHNSPNRWSIYAQFVMGGIQIGLGALVTITKSKLGAGAPGEKAVIQIPPPSAIRKKTKKKVEKKVLYRRRLSTTTLKAPTMTPSSSNDETRMAKGA